jgi:hypothetical protein
MALSDATTAFLKKAGFSSTKVPLSSALFTDFPYNITLDFPASEKKRLDDFFHGAARRRLRKPLLYNRVDKLF